MGNLHLALACGDYDRTRALADGSVRPDGIDLTYLRLPVEETFFRMMRHQEFDVAELSFSSYVISLHSEPSPFVAIPVFPSRMFRHGGIYINTGAGISPEDLRGKTVGVPEFQLSANVWIRRILADRHGVAVDAVRYRTGGQEQPGRIEKATLDHLAGTIDVRPIAEDQTLSQMLATGEIDALYSPRIPSPFAARDPRVARLFPDVIGAEKDYFAATGLFPIMHVVAIRRDVYEEHPWVAQSLYKAFLRAKDEVFERLYDSSALRFMLPWLNQQLEEARELLGDDYWSYGLDANREVLDTFLRYHHEQGLSPERLASDDLFAPEATEMALI